jgi:hypothetical protein
MEKRDTIPMHRAVELGKAKSFFERRDLRLALLFLLLPSFVGNIKASTDPFVSTVTTLINLWRKKGGKICGESPNTALRRVTPILESHPS